MRKERFPSLPWRFCRSGPPQTHMFFGLFKHSLGFVTHGLVGVGLRSYSIHPVLLYCDRDGCTWGRTVSSSKSLFRGRPFPWRFCRSDTLCLDLSHATLGAFDAVATLTSPPGITGEYFTWSDWRSQPRKSKGYPLGLTWGRCRRGACGTCLRGDRGVRERGAIIGVIFGDPTDVNFEECFDRVQRGSVRACAYPSLLDRSSWFGG